MIGIYTFKIITLGCRVNQYESRAIAEELVSLGLEESDAAGGCDLYIINTCAVTAESARKSRQMIRRAASLSSDPVVCVVGCWSQLEPEKAKEIDGVDLIMGAADKTRVCKEAVRLLESKRDGKRATLMIAPSDVYDEYSHNTPESVRAFLKIEDGCNGKCAYCIIPKARGTVRSRDPENALEEARKLIRAGAKEIVLTGIEISAYEYDLTGLIRDISGIEGLERIRLGSLEPSTIDERFVSEIASIPRVMPHFHLSLQSGCSRTLAAMRRKYNAEMASKSIAQLKSVFDDLMLTADVIVGFPGETEDDFSQTLEFLKSAELLHAHVFPYSVREGTPAALMKEQLPKAIKEERLKRIEDLEEKIRYKIFSSAIASKRKYRLLIEQRDGADVKGHTENFIPFTAVTPGNVGEIIEVVPTSFDGNGLKS